MSTTSALEDRRLRRDLQDTYTKVLDAVITNSDRMEGSAFWERGQKGGSSPPSGITEKGVFAFDLPETAVPGRVSDFAS